MARSMKKQEGGGKIMRPRFHFHFTHFYFVEREREGEIDLYVLYCTYVI